MADRYENFAALAAREVEGVDYRICCKRRPSPVVIVAPHGGWIEPGASHVATAIAGADHSLYRFDALERRSRETTMHIASTRFDEPRALALITASDIVLTVHGRKDGADGASIWVGGLHEELRDAIASALKAVGFSAKIVADGHALAGRHPDNICNRGRLHAGVQLELPKTLRLELLFARARLAVLVRAVCNALATNTKLYKGRKTL